MFGSIFLRLALCFLASLFILCINSAPAFAAIYFVDPAGNDLNSCTAPGGPMACKTIQGAINKTGNGDLVNVAAGTYAELITVTDRTNLTLVGTAGSTSIVPPAGPLVPNQPLVQILDSRRIGIFNLRVAGTGFDTEGFRIFYSTSVTIGNCTVEGHNGAGGGLFVNGSMGIIINAATIQDNGLGLRVDGNSQVALSSPPFAGANSVVQRNGMGVQVRSGELEFQGSGIIQENGTGIMVDGGGVKACCENQSAPRRVNNNIVGILVRTGSSVELRGPMEFIGNQNFAIRQFGSGVTISGKVLFQTNGNVVTSAINLSGGHLLLTGGVGADQVVIKDNAGTGIFLTDNASLRMTNVTITNNQVHGLRLQAQSSAVLAANIFMNNNSGRDLSCAPNTFARGNNSGVNTQYCPGFDNSPDPHGP